MRDDFCIFILTHGRPDNLKTLKTLEKCGYSGRLYLVIDDEDKTANEYKSKYGDMVLQFSKEEIESRIDPGDNFQDRRTILHARNACFDLAKKVGVKYFMQLDDDYTSFHLRFGSDGKAMHPRVNKMDDLLSCILDFFVVTPALSVAIAQGGDYLGGCIGTQRSLRRKAMNTFICSVDRPFKFRSTFNEDVATYTTLSRQGHLFFTVMQAQVVQLQTQSNEGGITELYKRFGTYVKSFSTIMHCPSSVQVGTIGDHRSPHYRIHHKINWHKTAPKILRDEHKKSVCQSATSV